MKLYTSFKRSFSTNLDTSTGASSGAPSALRVLARWLVALTMALGLSVGSSTAAATDPIRQAIRNHNEDQLLRLIADNKKTRNQALFIAIDEIKPAIVRMLLDHEADRTTTTADGKTPVVAARLKLSAIGREGTRLIEKDIMQTFEDQMRIEEITKQENFLRDQIIPALEATARSAPATSADDKLRTEVIAALTKLQSLINQAYTNTINHASFTTRPRGEQEEIRTKNTSINQDINHVLDELRTNPYHFSHEDLLSLRDKIAFDTAETNKEISEQRGSSPSLRPDSVHAEGCHTSSAPEAAALSETDTEALQEAIETNNKETILRLIAGNQAAKNTALFMAIDNAAVDIVNLLLANGAEKAAKNAAGKTLREAITSKTTALSEKNQQLLRALDRNSDDREYLDNKIKRNKRMISALDELASTLFPRPKFTINMLPPPPVPTPTPIPAPMPAPTLRDQLKAEIIVLLTKLQRATNEAHRNTVGHSLFKELSEDLQQDIRAEHTRLDQEVADELNKFYTNFPSLSPDELQNWHTEVSKGSAERTAHLENLRQAFQHLTDPLYGEE